MSTNPECECGHPRGDHTGTAGKRTACMYFPPHSDVCPCGEYLPVRSAALPPTPPPSGGVGGQPSVAQWARREALIGVVTWWPNSVHADLSAIDSLVLRWAKLIETGETNE